MTLVPILIVDVRSPTAAIHVSENGAWPPSCRHGWKWSLVNTDSKPLASAATAISTSSRGANCSAEALYPSVSVMFRSFHGRAMTARASAPDLADARRNRRGVLADAEGERLGEALDGVDVMSEARGCRELQVPVGDVQRGRVEPEPRLERGARRRGRERRASAVG